MTLTETIASLQTDETLIVKPSSWQQNSSSPRARAQTKLAINKLITHDAIYFNRITSIDILGRELKDMLERVREQAQLNKLQRKTSPDGYAG